MDAPITIDQAVARLDAEFGSSPGRHWAVTDGHGYELRVSLAPSAATPQGPVVAQIRVIAGTSEECHLESLGCSRDLDQLVHTLWTMGWDLAVLKNQHRHVRGK